YVEQLIGIARRECLDQVLIFGEVHLRQISVFICSVLTKSVRTRPWARMHHWADEFGDPASLLPSRSCPDCIITTSGYDFRKGPTAITSSGRSIQAPSRSCKAPWSATVRLLVVPMIGPHRVVQVGCQLRGGLKRRRGKDRNADFRQAHGRAT